MSKQKQEDPAFLFYPGDASEDTQFMNRLERGCYFDLLKAQKKFRRFTMEQIRRVLGKDFEECWPSIEVVLKRDGEFYFIAWVDSSIEKRKEYSKIQSERIQKYWDEKKSVAGNTVVLPRYNIGTTGVIPSGNGNGNTDDRNEISTLPKEREAEKKIEVAQAQLLTRRMVSSYKAVHPKYKENIHGDTMWFGAIAHYIAEENGWPKESILNGRMDDVLRVWENALEKQRTNSFWFQRTPQKLSQFDIWQEFSQFLNYNPNAPDKHVVGKTFTPD